MRRAALAAAACGVLAVAAAAQDAFRVKDVQSCPEGTTAVPTDSVYEPFHCVKDMNKTSPFIRLTPLYKTRACPKGSHPVDTPGLGQEKRYRCVMDGKKDEPDPEVAPVLPQERRAGKPASVVSKPSGFNAPRDYTRYTVHGQFQVEAPKAWHVSDGWDDEVPTFYVELDTGRQGKQVTLVVSKCWKGQEGYLPLEDAVAREKEWQNAVELSPGKVGTFPARFTAIAKNARTAYVASSDDSYYTLSYSAPDDLFGTFEPAYRRLLDSFRIAKTAR